jgi:hypothetical protein
MIREEGISQKVNYLDKMSKQNESMNEDFYSQAGNMLDVQTHQMLNMTNQQIQLDTK